MLENKKINWKAYAPAIWNEKQAFSSMVIYKHVNLGENWNAEFFDEHAQHDDVLNLAIGYSVLQIFDANQQVKCFLTPRQGKV